MGKQAKGVDLSRLQYKCGKSCSKKSDSSTLDTLQGAPDMVGIESCCGPHPRLQESPSACWLGSGSAAPQPAAQPAWKLLKISGSRVELLKAQKRR
ncbi:unnamed protein product [Symbiodinium natans]|uniref:Uncharacterized protein n=1 Tax=Symbiodinium natans TaxID=878477 RepID=A0A812SL98_9DINO|nr:unnamed protein product [Symbiodinium natans]